MLLGQELKFKNKLCNFKRVPFSVTFQGIALGIMAISKTPCKGKSFILPSILKLLPFQGDKFVSVITQGDALG